MCYAQEGASTPIAPIGTLEAGDFRALGVTADGDRLLVADAENQQVRVYDFTDPTQPDLLTALDVNGTPVLLAGGDGFGIVAVQTGGDSDSVELIASAFPELAARSIAPDGAVPISPRTRTRWRCRPIPTGGSSPAGTVIL